MPLKGYLMLRPALAPNPTNVLWNLIKATSPP